MCDQLFCKEIHKQLNRMKYFAFIKKVELNFNSRKCEYKRYKHKYLTLFIY